MTKHRRSGLDLEQENGGMPERKFNPERGEKTQWERVQMRVLANTTDRCVHGCCRRLEDVKKPREEDIVLR